MLALGWSGACATDAGIDDNKGGSGGADASTDGGGGVANTGAISSSDSGWPIGKFGGACQKNDHCESKLCVDVGKAKPNFVCTVPCSEAGSACPSGGYCAYHPDAGYVCVPENGNQCDTCVTDAECANVADRCTPSPNIDRFCARDCSFDGICPTGMTCVTTSTYPKGGVGGGSADGGFPDSGLGEAGPPSKAPRFCVPQNDESCPCNSERAGVKRKCSQTSGSTVCEGTESCNGTTTKWEGCTAGSPQPEVCDGADNDCNGTADDGSDQALCAGQGNPVHATWKCSFGQCEIGACDTGWINYPATLPPSAGCPCGIDSSEPDDTCGKAKDVGFVTDANTTALAIKGKLSGDGDEDWYTFEARDSNESGTNSYHVRMQFTAPANSTEFVFDVLRGGPCKVPDSKHSILTSYTWCVDGDGGQIAGKPLGEKSCGASAPVHCGPHTKRYYVRVKRAQGVAGTCAEYTLTVTAKGGGTCDFTQACDPQVDET